MHSAFHKSVFTKLEDELNTDVVGSLMNYVQVPPNQRSVKLLTFLTRMKPATFKRFLMFEYEGSFYVSVPLNLLFSASREMQERFRFFYPLFNWTKRNGNYVKKYEEWPFRDFPISWPRECTFLEVLKSKEGNWYGKTDHEIPEELKDTEYDDYYRFTTAHLTVDEAWCRIDYCLMNRDLIKKHLLKICVEGQGDPPAQMFETMRLSQSEINHYNGKMVNTFLTRGYIPELLDILED